MNLFDLTGQVALLTGASKGMVLAVFLASGANQYMTGQALTVCGGSNMWT